MWLEGLGSRMLDLNAMKKTKITLKNKFDLSDLILA